MAATELQTAMETVGTVAAIASDSAGVQERAESVLAELGKLLPIEAAEMCVLNPLTGDSEVLATHGYTDSVLENLHSDDFHELMRFLDLPETGRPVRMKDLPGDPLDNWAVSDVLIPAGFSEGMTMCLRTSDGRFTGVLNLSTTHKAHPSDIARDAIAHLCTALGNLVDPVQSGRWVSMLLGSGAIAVGLDQAGLTVALPGAAQHALLKDGTELMEVARRSIHMNSWSSFVWPDDNNYFRVRVVPCKGEQDISTLVSLDSIDLGPLSHRELEVLTLAAEGLSNAEIGDALVISNRTVGTHVEHILGKIHAPNRAAAASYALREGLILGKVDRHDA